MRDQLEHLYKAMDQLGNLRRLEDRVIFKETQTHLFTQEVLRQAEEVEVQNRAQLKELDGLSDMIKDLNFNYQTLKNSKNKREEHLAS